MSTMIYSLSDLLPTTIISEFLIHLTYLLPRNTFGTRNGGLAGSEKLVPHPIPRATCKQRGSMPVTAQEVKAIAGMFSPNQ